MHELSGLRAVVLLLATFPAEPETVPRLIHVSASRAPADHYNERGGQQPPVDPDLQELYSKLFDGYFRELFHGGQDPR